MQEMFLRKIPENMRPWECNVNGVKYVYPAGTEQQVPYEVAVLIDKYWAEQETNYPETGISFNDLRDRPFYETTEVLFDQRVEFELLEGVMGIAVAFPELLEPGKTYRVTYNGVAYDCIANSIDPGGYECYLGNASVIGMDGTGEPFFILVTMDMVAVFGSIVSINSDTSATVKIEKPVVHTIDPKFLPGGGGGGVVIVQDSAMASGIALAEQAAPKATMNAAQIAEAIFAGKTVYFNNHNNPAILPFTYGYRFGELASGVMTADALPDPYAMFGAVVEDGMYYGVKVYLEGDYNEFDYQLGPEG